MFARVTLLLALAALLCSSATGTAARVEMGGVKQMRYDKEGKLAAVIRAERVTRDEEGMLLMELVRSTVHTKDGDEVEIRAMKGRTSIEGTGDAFFEDAIEVISPDFIATMSRATWRESDNTVRGDEKIVLEAQGVRIVGSGFVVFAAENKVVIYKPRGTLRSVKPKTDLENKRAEETATPPENTRKPPESRSDE